MPIRDWNIDRTWTLFLDRDGVINKRIVGGYVSNPSEFEFIPGVRKAIAQLSDYFQLIFVITNQQGIAKGIMTERNVLEIHAYMKDQIYLAGGKIEKCYFAPNMEGAEEDIRKPNSAMALMAKKEFPQIQFDKCIMVGDTDSDIEFGRNLGMKTVRIKTEEPIGLKADLTVNSLIEFANSIRNES